ncbi:MAG: hypothetical protein ACW967_01450 [Candidatus Hodarchaeales archaeon]|jgi:predicted nucleic acid-binding Zn finger protein
MNNTDLFTPVSPHSVKKYNIKRSQGNIEDDSEIERWVVVGSDKVYMVKDDFCTCYSFILDNLKKISLCKHIKTFNVAKKLKQYDSFNISFSEYEKFRDEWLKDK